MGRIAVVIDSERVLEEGAQVTYVKNDVGGGDVVQSQHFGPPGDDSLPLPGDFAAKEDLGESGSDHATGYHDPKNAPVGAPGEVRRYARDASGEPVVEIHLKNDGTALIRVLKSGAPIQIETDGMVWLKSPNVRICDSAGRRVACVGDLVIGSVRALCASPGAPIVPVAGAPTPTGGVTFAAKIAGPGSAGAKA